MIVTINGLRIHHHGARASAYKTYLFTCGFAPMVARRLARILVGRFT